MPNAVFPSLAMTGDVTSTRQNPIKAKTDNTSAGGQNAPTVITYALTDKRAANATAQFWQPSGLAKPNSSPRP